MRANNDSSNGRPKKTQILLSSPSREKMKEKGSSRGFSFINIVPEIPLRIFGAICLSNLFPRPSYSLPKGITSSCYECRYKYLPSPAAPQTASTEMIFC